MSKRTSTNTSNTLFNYFTKTPPANKKPKSSQEEFDEKINGSSSAVDTKAEVKKRERSPVASPTSRNQNNDSDDDTPVTTKRRKRIRISPIDSDDSDTENKVDNTISTAKETPQKTLSDSFKYEPIQTPKSEKKIEIGEAKNRTSTTPAIKAETKEKPATTAVPEDGNWIHCKLDWLKPDKIRDAKKRRPDHPDYDPSTLFVPPDFYKEQTPAHRQWWEMKSNHYDCVLFFKVGKFYELYHMDAAIGVTELGFSFMKGALAHSGFPESAYGRMASTLVSKGYKVARVEQTETPDMMQERCKRTGQNSKWDKVVKREICQVTLRGTQVCGLQDTGPAEPAANYLMAIAEEDNNGCSTYGVCFIDTSIGHFQLGQFQDDKHSSRLLTTLAHYPPALVAYDRKTTSLRTSKLLSTHCHNARREGTAMWPAERTLKTLAEKYYRASDDTDWPQGLKGFLHDGDALGLTPAANSHLAIKALGGCVSYLSDCLLDIQILGMAQFEAYAPPDVLNRTLSQESKVENRWEGGNTMVLDAITLKNLRIVQDEGCLYDRLNFCCTAFGKRLLYQWVCAPSCNLTVIRERQEAIKELLENKEICEEAKSVLTTLPDLERLLAKVHSLGNLKRSKDHPDSRAIFYEDKTYSKRKVLDFLAVLNGFEAGVRLAQLFEGSEGALLGRLTQMRPRGQFPDYGDTLKFFKEAFNQSEAEKEGRIVPGAGVDQEYDNTLRLIEDIEQELQAYLKEQEKFFKCRLTFVGTDKKRFQIEVPMSAASKAGSDYHMESTRKGFKRFSTAETKEFLSRMMAAEEQKRIVLKDISRRIFEKFSSNYDVWSCAVQCLATVDILLSLTEFARLQSDVCAPTVTFDIDEKPYISIKEGRHPCIPNANDFIPNDTELGVDGANLLLLTGPNMGGKSTLMRQVALLTVLAHVGSYVPAQQCRLSLCDRIFTRLGASDDILSGQSTFLLEMHETACIVRHATEHSLLLQDELGRGTSTYDGTAIATAVCVELAQRGCRTLFSTHYHSLVKHLATHPAIVLGHMACMVETDESTADGDDIPEETITFLYKLSPGACPKSYGFNAARLGGIPAAITRRAHAVSRTLEREAASVQACRDVLRRRLEPGDAASLRLTLQQLAI